jgi:hypothetical protein
MDSRTFRYAACLLGGTISPSSSSLPLSPSLFLSLSLSSLFYPHPLSFLFPFSKFFVLAVCGATINDGI